MKQIIFLNRYFEFLGNDLKHLCISAFGFSMPLNRRAIFLLTHQRYKPATKKDTSVIFCLFCFVVLLTQVCPLTKGLAGCDKTTVASLPPPEWLGKLRRRSRLRETMTIMSYVAAVSSGQDYRYTAVYQQSVWHGTARCGWWARLAVVV